MHPLTVQTKQINDTVVLAIAGSADLHNNERLEREADAIIASKPVRVVVDMDGLEFLNSTALATLLRLHRAVNKPGTTLAVAAPSPLVAQVIHACNFDRSLTVHESLEEAVQSVQR